MTTAISGRATTLTANFDLAGVLTDPELPVLLTIAPAAGGSAVVSGTAVVRVSAGVFTYSWTPPAVTTATDYVVTWDPAGDDVSAVEVVTVLPATAGLWVTPEEALLYTGSTLMEAELAPASNMVSVYAGVTTDLPSDSITKRDRRWLGMATAFQAVWLKSKPGVLAYRESHRSTAADGTAVTREADSQIMLAPMAARVLKNLSWLGARNVPHGPAEPLKGSFIKESGDRYHSWNPRDI